MNMAPVELQGAFHTIMKTCKKQSNFITYPTHGHKYLTFTAHTFASLPLTQSALIYIYFIKHLQWFSMD